MKVLGFGAVLWDDIADPAAPPADSVAGEANIGGAVFNVVVHLQRLGYAAYMLSAIGRDPLGERTWARARPARHPARLHRQRRRAHLPHRGDVRP